MLSNTSGNDNTAIGSAALDFNTTGDNNTATGVGALGDNTTGSFNTANGVGALILNGSGLNNTATGYEALYSNRASFNTANGSMALFKNTTGSSNTANGYQALLRNTTGSNTATGSHALQSNTTGSQNTADGSNSLLNNKIGNGNTAQGQGALQNNTGSFNTAVGFNAGDNLTTGSDNIDIGSEGMAGESSTLRIGAVKQTAAYISGIYAQTVPNGVGVIIDSTGHLGTVQSSARFKEAMKPMDKASESILALQPVTFRYKQELDPDGIPQFGLVAEQVEKVNPDLVVRDEDGKVMTVRYEAVNAMLLNEFLKAHRKLDQQQAMIDRQQKQIEALTATVQKVSDQIALSKPAPQLVANP